VTDITLYQEAKVRNAQGGFSFSAGHLWPYKLISGLIRIALSRGLNLQTNTMVTEIGQDRTPEGLWPVTTDRGVVYARKIILATNAYTSALAPEYSKAIVPCKGLCTHIEPAPGASYQELPETYAIRHRPEAFIYQISRKGGSIVVGGAQYTYKDIPEQWHGNPDDGTLIQTVAQYFDGYMQRTFYGWENSKAIVKHIWTGGKFIISELCLYVIYGVLLC
jgi:glycine/D-amino acid oxidase-like deaminating enzyme